MGSRSQPKGQFLRERTCPGMPDDTLPCAVQKRLKRSRCRFDYMDSGGPKEACVTWGHIGATWRIRLNCPCATAIRPYVKLLGPLVMAALCNRAGQYIFALWFLSFYLSIFSPRLISAAPAHWMSTILRRMVWP